ncbi:MAG: c-type cytochrome [Zoogloeaceae bacterium]|nr:c-type cytochrome [Zoogloeaceae bacterium]
MKKALDGPLNGNPEKGKQLAQARNRGNCLACHVIPGGSQPGTRGPDLSHFGSSGRSDAEGLRHGLRHAYGESRDVDAALRHQRHPQRAGIARRRRLSPDLQIRG